jgi:hypothetical protein
MSGNIDPIIALQMANAQLTEENAQLKAQVAQHVVWRANIAQEIAILHEKCDVA